MKFNYNKVNICAMAFGKVQESSEGGEVKRYMGIGSSYILGVNPTKSELESIYDRTLDKDPE